MSEDNLVIEIVQTILRALKHLHGQGFAHGCVQHRPPPPPPPLAFMSCCACEACTEQCTPRCARGGTTGDTHGCVCERQGDTERERGGEEGRGRGGEEGRELEILR